MAQKKGIDISRYQGTPDFSKVKNDVDYVIIQAGFGRYTYQKDAQFERNYEQCKKYKIPVGVYWFSYAKTAEDAKKEAETCIEVIKGKKFEYPIYFDVEGEALTNKATVSACCKAFCGTLKKAGYYTGIYMSRIPAQTYLDDECIKEYDLWLAEYNSKLNWSGKVGMWQYSDKGIVSGINGTVDMDACYIDYPTIIKNSGKNGYIKPVTKSLDNEGFKRGDKSLGVYTVKRRLIEIGYSMKDDYGFGSGTEKAVNALLKKWGYKPNGIAGEKFIKRIMKG